MYNKKYILKEIKEFNGHNPYYDDIADHVCYLAYLNAGEIGWFMYESGVWFEPPHRVHTSIVKNVEYTDSRVIVTTQNTRLTFELI